MEHFNQEIKKVLQISDGDFFAKSRNIYIEIGNASRIKKLFTKLKKIRKEYVLFIDEVDFMDSENTKTAEELSKLKGEAYCVFGISATIMDPILKKEDSNLIVLSKPENYRGIESFNIVILPNKNSVLTKKVSNPIEDDTNLQNYLQTFANRKPYFVPIYNECHPVDTLIRTSLAKDPNRIILSYIATHFPSIPCMFYSGGGTIELYLPTITTPIELADGKKSKLQSLMSQDKNTEIDSRLFHYFTSTSPSFVKQWLYENGGVHTYTHIITIAGRLASRCISYGSSNFEQCKAENKLWWHLTEMYLSAASDTDQPELIQTAGRLCVATPRGDNIPLTLYATEEVQEDLIKAYWLQEELIDRANQEHNMGTDRSLRQLIQDLPIFKGKIPTKKRSLTKKVEYELNQVPIQDDGGYDISMYNFDNGVIGEEKKEEPEEKKEDEVRDMNYIEKTKKRIRDTLRKGNSCISIFLNQIDINASYNKEELLVLLQNSGYKQPASFLVTLTKISNYGFPCIFENTVTNSFRIFDDIKSAWN